MINDEALDKLVKGIIKIITKETKSAKFNKGVTGRITEIIDSNNYVVTINNKTYKAKSRFQFNINDVVKIISWNNDMNELYIIY